MRGRSNLKCKHCNKRYQNMMLIFSCTHPFQRPSLLLMLQDLWPLIICMKLIVIIWGFIIEPSFPKIWFCCIRCCLNWTAFFSCCSLHVVFCLKSRARTINLLASSYSGTVWVGMSVCNLCVCGVCVCLTRSVHVHSHMWMCVCVLSSSTLMKHPAAVCWCP